MNQKLEELKEQWRVEKAALALADAQNEIKEVGDALHLSALSLLGFHFSPLAFFTLMISRRQTDAGLF